MTKPPRLVKKKAIFKMMDDCAPGSTRRLGTHRYIAKYNGKAVHFPKGDTTLEVGHLKKIVSQLEIDRECARRHFPTVLFPPELQAEQAEPGRLRASGR